MDTTPHSTCEILTHAIVVDMVPQVPRKSACIETQLFGKSYEVRRIKRLLILEQQIVHFPKPILGAGALSSFRRRFGVRMYLREGEVAEHKPQPVAHNILNFFQDQMRGAAVWTFIVPVLD
jgi:hypothetical protein